MPNTCSSECAGRVLVAFGSHRRRIADRRPSAASRTKQRIYFALWAPAVATLVGCGDPKLPPVSSSLEDTNGNFALIVSNQSFAINPVDIRIAIDGTPVLQKYFEVGTQHNFFSFVFKLASGQHRITARTVKGQATLDQRFQVNGKQYATIFFWYYPKGDGDTPRSFTFKVQNGPPGFM